MEPMRSSPQPQPRMVAKKSPPRAAVDAVAAAAESPLNGLFYPPLHVESRNCTPSFPKGRTGVLRLALQIVNPSGVLLKVTHLTPRIANTRIHMTRVIRPFLVHLCTMVVEIIMPALHPSKPREPMIIRWIRRTQPQILMVTGGKGHFTTKQICGPLLSWTRKWKGGTETDFLVVSVTLHNSGVTFAHWWLQYLDASSLLGRCSVFLPFSSIVRALDFECNELLSTVRVRSQVA